jgi:adenylyl cyclase-associated protein
MQEWLKKQKSEERRRYLVSDEMLSAIDRFYFNHYCQTFRSGAFARANSSMYVRRGLSRGFDNEDYFLALC